MGNLIISWLQSNTRKGYFIDNNKGKYAVNNITIHEIHSIGQRIFRVDFNVMFT